MFGNDYLRSVGSGCPMGRYTGRTESLNRRKWSLGVRSRYRRRCHTLHRSRFACTSFKKALFFLSHCRHISSPGECLTLAQIKERAPPSSSSTLQKRTNTPHLSSGHILTTLLFQAHNGNILVSCDAFQLSNHVHTADACPNHRRQNLYV